MSSETARGLDTEELSHKDLVQKYKEKLAVLTDDSFLSDVSSDDTVKDVQGLLALAEGKAIAVHIKRFDGEVVSVIVRQGSCVGDVMTAFQRQVKKECVKKNRTSYINWRYVWKTYCLVVGQTLLSNKKAKLSSYGVGNQSVLHFTKRLRDKNRQSIH